MNIKKLHYITGLSITIFIAFHLFNHFLSLFGAVKHIEFMQNLRLVYRNKIIESVLLLAVFVQIISGLKLFLNKRNVAFRFFDKLQIWSGLYLAFFLLFHVSAVLIGRNILNLDTNYYFGVAGLNTFPFNLFFIPYYSLAIISFFGHIAAVHSQKMKKDLFGLTVEQQSRFIFTKGFIVTFIILYGLTNHFHGVLIPAEYNILIGK